MASTGTKTAICQGNISIPKELVIELIKTALAAYEANTDVSVNPHVLANAADDALERLKDELDHQDQMLYNSMAHEADMRLVHKRLIELICRSNEAKQILGQAPELMDRAIHAGEVGRFDVVDEGTKNLERAMRRAARLLGGREPVVDEDEVTEGADSPDTMKDQ